MKRATFDPGLRSTSWQHCACWFQYLLRRIDVLRYRSQPQLKTWRTHLKAPLAVIGTRFIWSYGFHESYRWVCPAFLRMKGWTISNLKRKFHLEPCDRKPGCGTHPIPPTPHRPPRSNAWSPCKHMRTGQLLSLFTGDEYRAESRTLASKQ